MKQLLGILLFSMVASLGLGMAAKHDFHVSILSIEHNRTTQSLELTLKVFTDDLERAVEAWTYEDLNLGTKDETERADGYLQDYLRNRIQISLEGKPVQWKWLGKEVELDATWCYLEVKDVANLKHVEIANRVLLELFEDQSNLVHLNYEGQRKSLYLKAGEATGSLDFP